MYNKNYKTRDKIINKMGENAQYIYKNSNHNKVEIICVTYRAQ